MSRQGYHRELYRLRRNLKLLMRCRNLTAAALAIESGLTKKQVKIVLYEDLSPSVEVLFRLADALNVPLYALFSELNVNTAESKEGEETDRIQ